MNEVTTTQAGGALAAADQLKGNLKKVQTQLPDQQGLQFLRFLQDGNWVFGQENEEVLPDDHVAVNPLSIKTGWTCWTNRQGRGAKNENLGESMVPLGSDPVPKLDLPRKTDPETGDVCEWKEQISADLKILNGPSKGKQVHYKTNSVGGISAMRTLIDQIILQLDEDPTNICPIISLDGDHYQHKSYGRTYTPVLKIKDWMGMEGPDAADGGDEAPADEAPADEAKPKRTRKKAEPRAGTVDETETEEVGEKQETEADETEEAETQPRRRRRRR